MRQPHRYCLALVLFVWALTATAGQPEALSSKAFAKYMPDQGIVIFEVNWGRKWGCAGVENAQLERLTFSRLPLDESSAKLDLKTPSKLFVNDQYVPYAYVVDPGTYAISGFDVKVAKSQWDVGHIVATKDHLFENGTPLGGTFEVSANEVVYIGHFGLDCAQETIPWRYYIEDKSGFDGLVSGFRHDFPFAASLPVRYRLFATTMFGQPFSLPEESSPAKVQ